MKSGHITPLDKLTPKDWEQMRKQQAKEHRIAMWIAAIALLVGIICFTLVFYNSDTERVVLLGFVGAFAILISLSAFFHDAPHYLS